MCGRYRLSRRRQLIQEYFDTTDGDLLMRNILSANCPRTASEPTQIEPTSQS